MGSVMTSQHHVNEALKLIRDKVSQRRLDGLYPPGLEEELEREFESIMSRRDDDPHTLVGDVKNLVLDYLAVIDHLAIMMVDLEERIQRLETGDRDR